MLWRVALVAVTLCAGCESPTRGFEAFYAAVADGDTDRALGRLTGSARAQMEAGAAASQVELGAALRAATVRTTLRKVTEVEKTGDTAIIEVTDALGTSARTTMKRVDGRWLIDNAAP